MRHAARARNSSWVNRLIVVVGLAIIVLGVVFYGDAPSLSRHYDTDPTAGDLNAYSLILVCAVGAAVALWGYTRNDPGRREWRARQHPGTDDGPR